MNEIRCLSPNIILNKSWHTNKVDLRKGWRIIIRGNEFGYVPFPKQAKIKKDEVDDCYYYNIHSGEMIPCYLVVPCQKCILCKDKKAVDWATRVTCEGNYHVNCPWWITLTYNDMSLPKDGLIKRDFQNFMKRLRERVERVICDDLKLRFVGVGEYGGNTARAHYHAVIFGLPTLPAKDILSHIENAWSKRVSLKVWKTLPVDFKFTRLDKNGKIMYYQRLGFAYVKPAHDSTPLYLAKYMFKPEFNTPEGKNPNFYLASRKNGIGYQYIVEFSEYHRKNPDVTKLDFLNKHTGKMCHFTIPQYFKNYWFPTPSRIIPPEVKKAYDYFQDILCRYEALKKLDISVEMLDDVSSMVSDLNRKYPFFKEIVTYSDDSYVDSFKIRYRDYMSSIPNGQKKHFDMFGRTVLLDDYDEVFDITFDEYVKKTRIELYMRLMIEYEYIMSLKFDTNELLQTLIFRDKHKGAMTKKMLNKPPVSPIDATANISYLLEKTLIISLTVS